MCYFEALRPAIAGAPCLFQLRNDRKDLALHRNTDHRVAGIDDNSATKSIVSPAGGGLYQLHSDGKIWRYTGTPMTGWELLDQNPATVSLAATSTHLYQRHNGGSIWEYAGPSTGWKVLDNNPATVAIAATGAAVYQLHNNGRIWRLFYSGEPAQPTWHLLDNNPVTVAITAGGGHLYQLHKNGAIWKYHPGPPSAVGRCWTTILQRRDHRRR